MPMIRYENENPEHFQRCSRDSAIRLEKEATFTPNRMQRAASVAYTVETHPSEQPLLQFLSPNKVEYYCNLNQDGYSQMYDGSMQNSNSRRHSSGNCEMSNKVSNITPPVPARFNKSPAIPERNNLDKLPLNTFPESNSKCPLNFEIGINAVKAPTTIQVKLPPPPQSSHSKRAAAALARNNKAKMNETKPIENKEDDPNRTQLQKTQLTNGTFTEIKALTPLQNAALFNNLQQKSTEERYFKFPKVVSIETYPKSNTDDPEAYSLARKKSGKKIPPPIQTDTNQILDDPMDGCSSNFGDMSKISTRHDSTLSCSDGGISQTSSPSYLVRSLESPLLPKIKTHSTNKHSKRRFITENLFSDINEFTYPKDNNNLSPPDLTKNQSTPGGLQTVVDYQQGANLPYQHKVIQNNRNVHCVSRRQLKFQFMQIVINVVVLLAVGGALAYYFRSLSNETTVKYINRTIISLQNMSSRPLNFYYSDYFPNNIGFYCTSLTTRFCIENQIPYNDTVFPNFFIPKHLLETDYDFDSYFDSYDAITKARCYQLAPLYVCSLFFPKCKENGEAVKPCKNLCQETKRRCGIFFEVFGLYLPKDVNCDSFPNSDDPDECVGYNEVLQHQARENNAACHDGFKCDKTRCIPADWRCDGHIDCEDETDESNCPECPGQLHCGDGKCIATSHICDGEPNCPWGQDERNCVRLSELMGDVGFGHVEVFVPEHKAFKTACIGSWDQQNSPKLMCQLLGYRHFNFTALLNRSENTQLQYIQYTKEAVKDNKERLFRELKNCPNNGSYPIVKARCSSYECGIRKQRLDPPNIRIIGGVRSKPGDWPFLAAILGGPKEIFYCAGVLISDQWVLSAAHCVGSFNLSQPPDDWTIQLGMTRRSSHSYFGQKLKVRRVIIHPKYNKGILHNNDIALFQLKERVKFHDHLLPVCMPSNSTRLEPPRECTVIGWGKRQDNEVSDYELTINEVQIPILNRSLCNQWLKKRNLEVTPQMICAGYEHGGKDACQGDSGGPLLCHDIDQPNKWFVGGIVSWGVLCANPLLPGIYANVPYFVKWIQEQMK